MGLFGLGKRNKELSKLRPQLKAKTKPKQDPVEKERARQAEFTAKTHRDYAPQPYGLRIWWVLGYDKKGKRHIDGPSYSAWDADRKLTGYDDGEIFEMRNIDTKHKAEEEIERILKERKEEEEGAALRILAPPTAEPSQHKPTEPHRRFRLPFSKKRQVPGGVKK